MSIIREPDHGKVVDVPLGQSLEIRLPENRTTGFKWHLTPAAASACTVVHDGGYVAPAAPMPGAGGEHRWRVEATTPGECDIELEYRRGWEHNVAPARSFRVRVRVNK
jgi:inhibitor of cysteine peptidase